MSGNRKLKFLLINPTSPLWRVEGNQKPKNSNVFRFSMLPSLYVAASMPDFVETQIVDEDVEPIDFNSDADLVGVSFMTYNAPRAYEIGDKFRALGKKVVFGGYHPTFMKEEAIQHADSICIGEAEKNMPHIINDFLNRGLKPFYKNDLTDLTKLPIPDRSLIKGSSYITVNTMQATRGCVNVCDFCSVAAFNRYKIRTRPVEMVIDEMKQLGKYVLFMDDNITLNKTYAKELFKAMIPLKKYWFSQCSVSIADDEELLELAVKSGCRGLFLGFESLSEQSLDSWHKHCNRKKNYYEVVKKLHDRGIVIFAAFVFGSDEDGPDVFENTLEFLLKSNVETLQSTRLTPFPGTPLFNRMDEEGRIFDKDWSHYDFFHVVHKPKKMSVDTLHRGTAWIQEQFYSYKNITRRFARAATYINPGIFIRTVVPLNLGYRRKLSAYKAFKLGKTFELA
jgi:radical SAM superfamily enzyme YgiQ (UPF0313 family)